MRTGRQRQKPVRTISSNRRIKDNKITGIERRKEREERAMTGTLKVEPAELRKAAGTFGSQGQAIQKLTNNMTQIVNQFTGSIWSGEAATAYKRKFDNLQDDINRMVRMINEHVTDLQDMAKHYESSEAANKALANSLKDDIIS